MKTVLLIIPFLITFSVFAQAGTKQTRLAPGCGPDEVKFEVKTEENPHPVGRPDTGKSLVYFFQDESEFNTAFKPTTRFGVDGGWVGQRMAVRSSTFQLIPGNIISAQAGNPELPSAMATRLR